MKKNKNNRPNGPKNSLRTAPKATSKATAQANGPRPQLFGMHAVREAWLNPARNSHHLYCTDQALLGFQETLREAAKRGLKRSAPSVVDKERLDKMLSSGAVHQGLALFCSGLPEASVADFVIEAENRESSVLVMLDQVTDPHNVGAIIRSVAAFGAQGVILQRKHAPELVGVLAKSACGGLEHVAIAHETNLSRALEELKKGGYFVYGLDEHGERLVGDIKPGGKTVLVLGAEGDGLRRLVAEHCDELVRLPTQPPIGSLNVSNAAAVALYALTQGEGGRAP